MWRKEGDNKRDKKALRKREVQERTEWHGWCLSGRVWQQLLLALCCMQGWQRSFIHPAMTTKVLLVLCLPCHDLLPFNLSFLVYRYFNWFFLNFVIMSTVLLKSDFSICYYYYYFFICNFFFLVDKFFPLLVWYVVFILRCFVSVKKIMGFCMFSWYLVVIFNVRVVFWFLRSYVS